MGLLNFGAPTAPTGLLGKYYDPAEERRQKMFGAMSSAGTALLQGGQGNFGQVLGQALAGANQGANNAGINYRQDAMGYQQLEAQMNEQKEKERNKAAVMQWLDGLPEDQQELARVNPQMAAEAYMKAQMNPEAPKPPSVDTFYDENTGQPYKGQWNPQTQKWDRVGGMKADENGITITNPDGTTTQIGGSGTKTTEADRRAILLAQQIASSKDDVLAQFDTLTTLQNSAGTTLPGGRAIMSGEAQVAEDALKNVVANWLYLTSGATATDKEVERQFQMLRPTVIDDPIAVARKKARLETIIQTMEMRAGIQGSPAVNAVPQKKPPVTINGYTIEEVPLWPSS